MLYNISTIKVWNGDMHANYALSQHYSTHAKPKQIAWPFRVLSASNLLLVALSLAVDG